MKKGKPAASGKQIRVIVADDHPVVREGLAAIVKAQGDMKLVGEAADGKMAVREYFRQRPDVILLDLRMPEMNGIEATRTIRKRQPRAKAIVLSTYKGDEDVYQAFKAGAAAYLLKDASSEELMNCIRSVHAGRANLTSFVASQLASHVATKQLTKRETEILAQVVNGKSNKEIGALLGITEGTVKVHFGSVMKKLGARGRSEAIRLALERGLAHLPNL